MGEMFGLGMVVLVEMVMVEVSYSSACWSRLLKWGYHRTWLGSRVDLVRCRRVDPRIPHLPQEVENQLPINTPTFPQTSVNRMLLRLLGVGLHVEGVQTLRLYLERSCLLSALHDDVVKSRVTTSVGGG